MKTNQRKSAILEAALVITIALVLAGMGLTCSRAARAQQKLQANSAGDSPIHPKGKLLYSFQGAANGDGQGPDGGLISDAAGNFYGVTGGGGCVTCGCLSQGCGTVYKLSPQANGAWSEEVLCTFELDGCDGAYPFGGLVFDKGGNLYGTTLVNTVFELSPQPDGTWVLSVIYQDPTESLDAGLVFDAVGNLYGTTSGGGTGQNCLPFNPGCGTVFELSPQPGGDWTATTLYNFLGSPDGAYPDSQLVFDPAGNLYGTTRKGGIPGEGDGVVFELSPQVGGGWAEAVVHAFTGNPDGAHPQAGLIIDSVGNLYGMTVLGGDKGCRGKGCGTVFELSPESGGGWAEDVLYNFDGQDGAAPGYYEHGNLVMDNAGNLYGATYYGGNTKCSSGRRGCGTVFTLMPRPGGLWIEKDLSSSTIYEPLDGLLLDKAGDLYGTSYLGGNFAASCPLGCGTVFEIQR